MRSVLTPLAVVAILAAGCGSETPDKSDAASTPTANQGDAGAYFFESVRADRADAPPGLPPGPTTLASMLPCGSEQHRLAAEAVLVGEVTSAKPGDAYIWGDEEDTPKVLKSYDDTRADARDILITFSARTVEERGASQAIVDAAARMTVPEGADPVKFLESAADLGEVVAFLSPRPTEPHQGDFFPALNGALIGVVDDGAVTFPGMEDPDFAGDLTTTEALLDACPTPAT